MICKKCGANIPDGSAICNYCGEVQGETTLISEQPTQGTPPKNEKGKNQAVASMILGIVTVSLSILGTCCGQGASVFFAFIFLAASIVGLVLASSAKKKGYVGGMATAGLVLNIIDHIRICFIGNVGHCGCRKWCRYSIRVYGITLTFINRI